MRTRKFHFCGWKGLHRSAQLLGRLCLDVTSRALLQNDGQLADVFARLGRISIQPRTRATDAIQRMHARHRGITLLQGANELIGVGKWRSRRQLGRHLEAALGELRNQVHAQGRQQGEGKKERDRRTPQYDDRSMQGPRQCAHIALLKPRVWAQDTLTDRPKHLGDATGNGAQHDKQCRQCCHTPPSHARTLNVNGFRVFRIVQRRARLQRGQHWNQRHRHRHRHQHGDGNGERLIAEQLPRNTLDEDQREEDRDGCQCGRHHGHANLGGAHNDRLQDVEPALSGL
ncbi:MAG: hypothetical protein BWZ07_02965 [Alphaproteobacteria bacterium ADurb.BinA280]|nr:MAG: hypothetical protein BWZ07_02965 [Alphaproteobacteria bacterium ADurb.BinA280]